MLSCLFVAALWSTARTGQTIWLSLMYIFINRCDFYLESSSIEEIGHWLDMVYLPPGKIL